MYDPRVSGYLAHCQACCAGHEVRCLRKDSKEGLCPVMDTAPDLPEDCTVASTLYTEALATSKAVTLKDGSVHTFCRPADLAALMDIHGIPQSRRRTELTKIRIIEEVANRLRPKVPKS